MWLLVLTVLTALSVGFEEWLYELENSRTMSKLEQNSWKLLDKKFEPLSLCILLGMPHSEKIFKNTRRVLSAIWSTTGSMHTNLEYLSTLIKNSFPWNSKISQGSVSQGFVHTKAFFKLSDGCMVENLFQISQLLHSCLISPFISGKKRQVVAVCIVFLVPKWETLSLFKAFCPNSDSIASF